VPSRRLTASLFLSVLFTVGWQAGADAASPVALPTVPAATAAAPDDTVNEFLPEDRSIGDCISAAPRPGCGSKSQGGWHQYLVLIALVAGLGVIGWRIVAGVRTNQPS